jgi:hypothetical protein
MTFGFHKVQGVAEDLLACQEELCFMELVIFGALTAVKIRSLIFTVEERKYTEWCKSHVTLEV